MSNHTVESTVHRLQLATVQMVRDISPSVFDPDRTIEPRIRMLEHATRTAMLELRTYIASNKIVKNKQHVTAVVTVDLPFTWWDHLKAEALPQWITRWLKPYTVKRHTDRKTVEVETMTVELMCPHIPVDKKAVDEKCVTWVSTKEPQVYPFR